LCALFFWDKKRLPPKTAQLQLAVAVVFLILTTELAAKVWQTSTVCLHF